jgi:hypothetical protein
VDEDAFAAAHQLLADGDAISFASSSKLNPML